MKCDVCQERESIGVVASSMAPCSFPICEECLVEGKEPDWIIKALAKDHDGQLRTENDPELYEPAMDSWKPTEEMVRTAYKALWIDEGLAGDLIAALIAVQPLIAKDVMEAFLKRVKQSGLNVFNNNTDLVNCLRALVKP